MSILYTNRRGTFFDEALKQAIRQGNNTKIWSILQNQNPCDLSSSLGLTLLHYAAEYGNTELVQKLLDLGLNVDAITHFGETPLMLAVEANQEETVRVLLKAKAKIFEPNFNDRCALGKAFTNRHVSEEIRTALLNQVTIESLNNSREYLKSKRFRRDCPIYYFISLGNAEITEILLECGSPVDAKKRKTGETALFVAVNLLDVEHVKVLLKFNANVNIKTRDGKTLLMSILFGGSIIENKVLAIVKMLINAGVTLSDPMVQRRISWYLLKAGDKEIVRAVLQNEINLQKWDQDGIAPLSFLSMNKHPDILEELRSFDFNVNLRCAEGRRLLHYAAMVGNASSIKFLLELGGDVNARDMYYRTPLYYAANRRFGFSMSVIVLLDAGADPHIYTEDNEDSLLWWPGEGTLEGLLQVMTPILASLVLLEASGRAIEPYMQCQIEKWEPLKTTFALVKSQFEEMKQVKIGDSVTLCDFLKAKDGQISLFARNKSLVSNLGVVIKDRSVETSFDRKLNNLFSKWSQLVERRQNIVSTISKLFNGLFNVSVENIAEKIVKYLNDDELYTKVDKTLY